MINKFALEDLFFLETTIDGRTDITTACSSKYALVREAQFIAEQARSFGSDSMFSVLDSRGKCVYIIDGDGTLFE